MIVITWILIALAIVIFLVSFAETLLWWYLWQQDAKVATKPQTSWKNAVVFLTGISDYAAPELETEQIEFLQELSREINPDLTIAEPFPYQKLTAATFAKYDLWRLLGFKQLPLWLISLHNFWQAVLVIVLEKTYGNGVANCIINKLGLPKSSAGNLCFICGSVGASLALAAAPKLKEKLQTNLIIITYGGVYKASRGFDFVDNFYDLIGEKDFWARLGKVFCPGRYLPIGYLEKARQENRFQIESTGNHEHMEYLSDRLSEIPETTYRQQTLNTIIKLIK